MIKEGFWKLFYSSWKNPVPEDEQGYTLLLPVPGDLPVFLKLALAICKKQDLSGLSEILVIPDRQTKYFKQMFADCSKHWREGRLRLVHLRMLDSLIISLTNEPRHIHWLQLIRGIDQAKTKYGVLHDADLFLRDHQFFKDQYERIRIERLDCLGADQVSDPWFTERGINHLVRTWELFFSSSWIKSFAPCMLRSRVCEVKGEEIACDTLLWAQCQTDPLKVGMNALENRGIHFHYVISTYRWFQKAHGQYEDEYFRLLLIRLLHESLCTDDEEGCEVPSVRVLAKGINSKEPTPVSYKTALTWEHYLAFRSNLQSLLTSGILDPSVVEKIQEKILPFDKAFKF